ncbi:MAG TPA: hydrogenase maturation protease [Gaiellaceae bacterium]|nr:hydrogenase maturation protease [Gaiellaceae bacterium]
MTGPRVVVVGVGNALRGDDGAGLAVAARLEGRVPDGVAVVPCVQEPSRLVDAWRGAAAAVVVDAVASGASPGTLHRFDAGVQPLPGRVFRSSTHAFGVGETIELARALGALPARVLVYGVEGAEFAAGEGLTPAVDEAVDRAAAAVLDDVDRLIREEGACTSRP